MFTNYEYVKDIPLYVWTESNVTVRIDHFRTMKIQNSFLLLTVFIIFGGFQILESQEYSIKSYQVTDQHRFDKDDPGLVGGFWGHHLGHMVRTSTQGLWYVDDTGTDVNKNPAINYHHFDGIKWTLIKTLANPATIQQNTATLAVGDTIYTYGLNVVGGYIEEAIFDAKTNIAVYNRKIQSTGSNTNYIGAALSPNGTRVVWWTKVDYNGGPSDWVYIYTKGGVWNPNAIVTKIPGNDFSYVFASFLNDSVFYVGGEVPSGIAPNWTYEVGAGKVVLGSPISGFTKMKGSNTAVNDLWVNRVNGDAHLFSYGSYGTIGYFYKPANGVWSDSINFLEVGSLSRWRFIDSPDGNLYLILSQGGFKFIVIPKNTINGKISITGLPVIPINNDDGFTGSYAIWPEVREYQTTPVGGINFAYPGNDYSYSNLLRHVVIAPNDGSVLINLNVPNGNETYQADIIQKLSWYSLKTSGIDSVKIELSSNGGSIWSTIISKTPNIGYYSWKVPRISSANCLIRISHPLNSTVYDVSNTPFTIQYTIVIVKAPVSVIVRPTKDTTILVSSMFSVRGTASDTDGYIVNYIWKMGDGQLINGIVTEFDYTYDVPGKYVVTFSVQDNDNLFSLPDSITITVKSLSGVTEPSEIPNSWKVFGNYPNPFNNQTIFRYQSAISSHVQITVYDILGQYVASLFNDDLQAGDHSISWTGKDYSQKDVSSGIYFVRFETSANVSVVKAILLR